MDVVTNHYFNVVRDLAKLPVDAVLSYAAGDDHHVVEVVDAKLVFRFKKRIEEKEALAREVALLAALEGKLSFRIPQVHTYFPEIACFSYTKLEGARLTAACYQQRLTSHQQAQLAHDIALFAYQMSKALDEGTIVRLNLIGFDWPYAAQVLEERLSTHLVGEERTRFMAFLICYKKLESIPYIPQLVHSALHERNLLIDEVSGCLQGVIDFSDVAVGDVYLSFRNLHETTCSLMQGTVVAYAQLQGNNPDIVRAYLYYLATEYSRLLEGIERPDKRQDGTFVRVRLQQFFSSHTLV